MENTEEDSHKASTKDEEEHCSIQESTSRKASMKDEEEHSSIQESISRKESMNDEEEHCSIQESTSLKASKKDVEEHSSIQESTSRKASTHDEEEHCSIQESTSLKASKKDVEGHCSIQESTSRKELGTGKLIKSCIHEVKQQFAGMQATLQVTQETNMELPMDIIRDMIYPILPACDVLRAWLIAKCWNNAYLDGINPPISLSNPPLSLGQTQPAHGGSIPLGFLLSTDGLQRCATSGMKTLRRSRGLENEFSARHPRIISACYGFYCVFLNNPEEMVIWNPAVGQKHTISPPVSTKESYYTGLAISFQEGDQVVNKYWIVVPYLPTFINVGAANPRVRFRVWNSQNEAWLTNPAIIDIEEFSPRNVVTIKDTIYFHISTNEVVFYHVGEGQPGSMIIPVQFLGVVEVAICKREGCLGVISYDMAQDNIQMHLYDGDTWIPSLVIDMKMVVETNRVSFLSLSQDLRSRLSEDADEALLDIGLVGYADPGWLLVTQRDGWILLGLHSNTARRLHFREFERKILPGDRRLLFMSHTSTFLRLF